MLRFKFRFRFLLVLAGAFMSTGCYYVTQGRYLLSYQQKAQSVEKLLKKPDLPEETRRFLLLVKDIRNYASGTLGLKDNKNYTKYLTLNQDVLAWVVSGSDPLAFRTHLWTYPFLGKLPYKGFYRKEDARKEALRLKEEGQDVWVRGVEAFSTLGIFRDPLISYMTGYKVYQIAELIIHEQTHATVWRKGDTTFNEDLASFVGDEGARLYVRDRYGEDSPEYRQIAEEKEDSRKFREDIFRLRNRLDEYYRSLPDTAEPSPEETAAWLAGKDAIIRDFQREFFATADSRYSSGDYRKFAELPVNNAYLELFSLYSGNRDWFEQKYADAGYNMKVFISSLR